MMVVTLGERLRELRNERKQSLQNVEREMGIPFVTLGSYERDEKKPSLARIALLADYYDVTVDYLLGRSNHKWLNEGEVLPHELEGIEIERELIEVLRSIRARKDRPWTVAMLRETLQAIKRVEEQMGDDR